MIPQQAPAPAASAATAKARFTGKMKGATAASVGVAPAVVDRAAAGGAGGTMVAKVTLPHPRGSRAPRTFDVLVNASAGISSISPDSPYYAGTIAFFGSMPNMSMNATFHVPLTKALVALKTGNMLGGRELQIGIVPHATVGPSPAMRAMPTAQLRAVTVEVW